MAEKQKKSSLISLLIFILIGAAAGFIIAFYSTKISGGPNPVKNDFLWFMLNLVLILFILIASIYVQIVLHEAGHLVFGLLSGYKFVSFRVGSLTLIRKSGKFQLKTYKIPGTGGQCLMMPPQLINGDFPYKLYNLGGVLFNFIFSGLAILCILIFNFPVISTTFLLAFAVVGIIFGLLNGIPLKLSGIANDGYNIYLLNKDKISRWAFYLQLKINGLQAEGMRLKEMPDEWFVIPENTDVKNNLHLSILLLRSSWYIDQLRFDEARQFLEDMEPYASNLLGLYQNERTCELLFCEMIGEFRPERIAELYTESIKTYIQQYNKYLFSKKRILYAYMLIIEKDKVKSEVIFNEALKMKDRYPVLGDAESELDIMEYVRSRYN